MTFEPDAEAPPEATALGAAEPALGAADVSPDAAADVAPDAGAEAAAEAGAEAAGDAVDAAGVLELPQADRTSASVAAAARKIPDLSRIPAVGTVDLMAGTSFRVLWRCRTVQHPLPG
jgi:hypothetical protein